MHILRPSSHSDGAGWENIRNIYDEDEGSSGTVKVSSVNIFSKVFE